nr:TolC family protein [uncultured Flavobacterium sp.]
MFNTRNYLKFGFCLALFLSQQTQAQDLSFTDAYNKMYLDNNTLKAVNKHKETQEYVNKAVKGLRYPSLNAYGIGVVFDKKLDLSFNDARNTLAGFLQLPDPGALGDWKVQVGKKEMAFAGLNATWPIFTGGKINTAVKATEIETEIAEKTIESTENHLISELVTRYFQVKLADEAYLVRQQVLDAMKHHLFNATKLEENGIIAPAERLVANVAVSEANREFLAAEKNIQLARTALANTLDKDEISESLSTPFVKNVPLNTLEHYKEAAVKNYPELQKIILQKELADQGIKAKKANYYPDIAIFGQTVLLHNDPIAFGILESAKQKPWVVGVGVTYNIFGGFKNKNELKVAISTRESIDFLEAKAQKDVKTLVENLYFEIQKSEEELQNLKVQEEFATELLRVRTRAFAEGLATSTDVIDAETNLSVVKLLILNTEYLYSVSLANLFEFSGQSKEFLKYTN